MGQTLWVSAPVQNGAFLPPSHLTDFTSFGLGKICEIGWWEVVLRQAVLWPKTDSI